MATKAIFKMAVAAVYIFWSRDWDRVHHLL